MAATRRPPCTQSGVASKRHNSDNNSPFHIRKGAIITDLQLKQPREDDRVAYKSDIDGLREYVAGSERRLDEKIDGLAHRLDEKIDNVATQLNQKLDLKFGALDQKIDNVANTLDTKIGALDQKIDHVASTLDTKISALDQKLDLRFDSLAKQIQIFSWVGGGIATIMASAILLLISRSL